MRTRHMEAQKGKGLPATHSSWTTLRFVHPPPPEPLAPTSAQAGTRHPLKHPDCIPCPSFLPQHPDPCGPSFHSALPQTQTYIHIPDRACVHTHAHKHTHIRIHKCSQT